MDFVLLTTTSWLDPGRVFGCIYNWAGIQYRRLVQFFSLCFHSLWFYKKRGTRSNAHRSAEPETETPFWILDSPTFILDNFLSFTA
jgi:hypothetical protein